jgi:peptide alpha-N-acetyltransferase
MKGLILNSMGKKEDALESIRSGIKNNMSSHVVWHVYGLYQRSERKYDEAIKAYKKALQCEKDSLTILRDLSLLQIQMRDLEGYKETRHQLFNLKPGQRQSWIGFAMSYHLLGDYDMAQSVLEEFRKTQQDRPAPSSDKPYDNEHSEFLLYQNLVLREAEQYEDALRHIQIHEKDIYNKLALAEIKYDLYIRLNTFDRAETILRDLIERNPENKKYYFMLEKCLHLTNSDEKSKLYENLIEKYPRADAPKQICLQFLTGNLFENIRRLIQLIL